MTESRSSRPRDLNTELQSPDGKAKPEVYKASMHVERQKFMKPQRLKQLYFKETGQELDQTTRQSFGLDLDVGQAKALAAVQTLLYDTGFKGNGASQDGYSGDFKGHFSLPVLQVTPSDYYEAYGLEKKTIGKKEAYPGRQRAEAIQDLLSLDKARRIIYERKHFLKSGKEVSDIIIAPEGKLVNVHLAYEELEQEEVMQIKAGDTKHSRISTIIIACGIPFIDQVDSHFILKRRDLFKQIAVYYPGKRQPRGLSLLVEYLWTVDLSTLEISKEQLARYANLGSLLDSRHKTDALATLQEYLGKIKGLGYILNYSENGLCNYILELNPDMCSRVKSKQKRLLQTTKKRP